MAMRRFLHYDDKKQEIEVTNPSAKFVKECIKRLDNVDRTSIGLMLDSLHIVVGGGGKDRVLLIVMELNDPVNTRCLVDPTVEGERKIPIWSGGQCADEPLNQTVPKQKAIDVILYCFEKGEIPDGLEWAQR